MPITFNCSCGKLLRVPDENAGKRVKCPACAGVSTVPRPEPEPMFEVVEDTSVPLVSPPPPPRAKPTAKPVVAVADDDDDDDRRGYGVSKSSRDDDDDEEEKPKPKKKKPKWKKERDEPRSSGGGGSGSATGEIIGGLIAMLLGAGLVFLALANERNRGLIYGTVLFIAGLIGLIKGLAGGSGE